MIDKEIKNTAEKTDLYYNPPLSSFGDGFHLA